MIKEKISSQEIIDLVASKASVSKRAAEEFLKVMIASIEEGLLAGETVKIKSFGTFKLQWNEPRKSVNIQTKEEILINGYYKVAFVPDATLKEQVNEPFAHLEPVELDTDPSKNDLIENTDPVSDPLRIFNEQAFEIKNLISEIQALSKKTSTEIHEVEPIREIYKEEIKQIPENEVEEDETDTGSGIKDEKKDLENVIEETETQPEISEEEVTEILKSIPEDKIDVVESEVESIKESKRDAELTLKEEEQPKIHDIVSTAEPISTPADQPKEESSVIKEPTPENNASLLTSELPSTPYLDNIKPPVRNKKLKLVLLILLLVIGSGTGLFIYFASTGDNSVENITRNISVSEMINTISGWITPAPKPAQKPVKVVIPKDTADYESTEQIQPVDSLQLLFDNPRVYTEFIASERIHAGNRLTIMSKRYFKNKEFWVYIYEANKDKITNPDNIAVGTFIRIPKIDPRLIDTSNPRCLIKAKELHDIYIK